MADKNLKIIQINIGRGYEGHSLLESTALRKGVDLILVSEINKRYISHNSDWYFDYTELVGIKCLNENLLIENSGRGSGFVWIEINNIRIYSCYISPNCGIDNYKKYLFELEIDLKKKGKNILITGDFNSKSFYWGCSYEDIRGQVLSEWMDTNNFLVQNLGNKPTFERGGSKSILDITFADTNLNSLIKDWNVLPLETLSDHNYIYFEITTSGQTSKNDFPIKNKNLGWNLNKLDIDVFCTKLNEYVCNLKDLNTKNFMKVIVEACTKSMPVKVFLRGKKGKFWWSKKINDLRNECIKARRNLTRARRKNNYIDIQIMFETLKMARKLLRIEIRFSKKSH